MTDEDRRITREALLMFSGKAADEAAQLRHRCEREAAAIRQDQAERARQMADELL